MKAEEQLRELGCTVSTILHVDLEDGVNPQKSVEVRLPIKSTFGVSEKLHIMHLSDGKLIDITEEAQPKLENNFVTFHVDHFSA